MKKYETQSLALDGCSQVSLSITRTSLRPVVLKLQMHPPPPGWGVVVDGDFPLGIGIFRFKRTSVLN